MIQERSFYGLMLRLPPWLRGLLFADQYHLEKLARLAARELPAQASVLDAGAGECRYRPLFARQRYVAVDFGCGDAQYDYGGLDALGDVQRLPLADGAFDAVLSMEVLEHVPEPGPTLRELARVLRPGGVLYLSTPLALWVHQAPHHFHHFTPYALRRLMEQAGLRVDFIRPRGGYFHHLSYYLSYSTALFYPALRQWWGWVLLPLLALNVVLTGVVLPVLLFPLDGLDVEKRCTTGYVCRATRLGGGVGAGARASGGASTSMSQGPFNR